MNFRTDDPWSFTLEVRNNDEYFVSFNFGESICFYNSDSMNSTVSVHTFS